MKKGSTLFLRGVIVLIGLATLGVCALGIPKVVGTFSWGGYDPILLGMYLPAIPFFYGLLQAWTLLDNIDRDNEFSSSSVMALKRIKLSALTISGLYVLGMPYIFYVANLDDAPGVVLIGLIIIGASLVVSVFAAVLQKLLKNGMEIKSENDLVV